MAGELRPNADFRESLITIINAAGRGNAENLVNGLLDTDSYTNAWFGLIGHYVQFSIIKPTIIWGITGKYVDGAGETSKLCSIRTEDKNGGWNNGGQIVGYTNIPSNYNEWYPLTGMLTAGTYRIVTETNYSGWQEWFGQLAGDFIKLTDSWSSLSDLQKKDLFLSTLIGVRVPIISALSDSVHVKLLNYCDTKFNAYVHIKAIPANQLVTSKGLISIESFEGIDKVTLTSTVSGKGILKLLATTDNATYQTYDFIASAWKAIDHTNISTVKTSGIDATKIGTIDRTAWDDLTTGKLGVGFAYLLCIEDATDICAVDKLDLQVDMKGSWDKAVQGTDYKYGYPRNNILRVQLLSNGDYKINYQK